MNKYYYVYICILLYGSGFQTRQNQQQRSRFYIERLICIIIGWETQNFWIMDSPVF